MKQFTFFTTQVVLFIVNLSFSQIEIETLIPDKSVQLEVKSFSKEMLIPRVSLTDYNDNTTIVSRKVKSLSIDNIITGNIYTY